MVSSEDARVIAVVGVAVFTVLGAGLGVAWLLRHRARRWRRGVIRRVRRVDGMVRRGV